MSLKSIAKITATTLLAAVLLTSCAHPDFIKPGTSYDVVIQELGQPDSTSQMEDGSIRLVYSGQPYDQSSYVMIFNPEGKMTEKYNILQEKYFKLIKPKVMHSEDILVLLGTSGGEMDIQESWRTYLHVSLSGFRRFPNGTVG